MSPPASPSPLQLSVVVEWENVILSEMGRAIRMLRRLHHQVGEIAALAGQEPLADEDRFLARIQTPVELLVMYNAADIAEADVRRVVSGEIPPDGPHLRARFLSVPDQHYYELKNHGAREASGDLVVFLDSDVVPEPAWLRRLLGAFARPEVRAVSGAAFVDPESLYAKAFALAWFFDPPGAPGGLEPSGGLFANNFALWKETAEAYPFPPLREGASRRACVDLAQRMEREGAGLYKHFGAQVSHPAPNGGRHFFLRALVEGRDDVIYEGGEGKPAGVPALARQYAQSLKRSASRIVRNRRRARLSPAAVPAAVGLMSLYRTAEYAGRVITHVRPSLLRGIRM